MTAERWLELTPGRSRILGWGDGDDTVLFLHGLTGVAEVWEPTISMLPPGRRYLALDQRGHGQSPRHESLDYAASAFLKDTVEVIDELGGRVHLVGHSMGARIALLAAARHPDKLRSTTIVDIGPEASVKNISDTITGLARRPDRFANRTEALAFGFRSRTPTSADEAIFLARLQEQADGSLIWLSPTEVLGECVRRQRSRNYWTEWRSIRGPAMFVHGGASNEVSTAIADRMHESNPRVRFERLPGVGHNVPLLAPDVLAALLQDFWRSLER